MSSVLTAACALVVSLNLKSVSFPVGQVVAMVASLVVVPRRNTMKRRMSSQC